MGADITKPINKPECKHFPVTIPVLSESEKKWNVNTSLLSYKLESDKIIQCCRDFMDPYLFSRDFNMISYISTTLFDPLETSEVVVPINQSSNYITSISLALAIAHSRKADFVYWCTGVSGQNASIYSAQKLVRDSCMTEEERQLKTRFITVDNLTSLLELKEKVNSSTVVIFQAETLDATMKSNVLTHLTDTKLIMFTRPSFEGCIVRTEKRD